MPQSKMLTKQIWGASIWMRNQKILINTNLAGGYLSNWEMEHIFASHISFPI